MPVYTLQGPDGKTYDVEGPAGATADQLGQFISGQQPPKPQGNAGNASMLNRIGTGFMDTIVGGAQSLAHAPTSLLNAINASGDPRNTVTEQEQVQGRAGVDKMVQQREQQYQADRKAAGQEGFDGARLVGNLASTVPLAAAVPGGGAGLLGRTVASTVGSAVGGAAMPVTEGNFADEKQRQLLISGLTGAVAPSVASAASRVIKPQTSEAVKTLMSEGVTPTIGQIAGGAAARTEEKLMSVPLLGDMIKNAQNRTREDFNRAAYSRVLKELGQKPSGAVGREGVAEVKDALSQSYNTLLPKLQFKADKKFSDEVSNLQQMAQNGNIPPEIAKQFDSILKNEVFSRLTKQGSMDGIAFKELESSLGQKIKGFVGSQNPNDRALGSALSEVLSSARGVLSRTNPQYADELTNINRGYANYARVRDAASRQGAEDGVFTPAQLSAAIRAGDKSAGKGNFATGDALMQDLSDAGKGVIGSKVPNSGTADRLLTLGALGGAGTLNPLIPAAAGVAMLPYSAGGQKLMAKLLTQRPDLAEPIAKAVRSSAPALGVSAYPLVQSGQQ